MEWVIGFVILWLVSLFDTSSGASRKSSTNYNKPNDKAENTDALKASQEVIDNFLEQMEDENKKPMTKEVINVDEKELVPEQQEIKEFIDERNIIQLIHFTSYENLESILTNGLITRDELKTSDHTAYVNDSLRLDRHPGSISLSVSFPNYKMFYKCRKNYTAENWVILAISPEVLWEYECAFCKHNAADSRISNKDINDLSGVSSLREMFLDDNEGSDARSEKRLKSFDPTDPQAEVLVFGNIPAKYILGVGFENQDLLSQVKNKYNSSHIKFMMAKKYFHSREYVR